MGRSRMAGSALLALALAIAAARCGSSAPGAGSGNRDAGSDGGNGSDAGSADASDGGGAADAGHVGDLLDPVNPGAAACTPEPACPQTIPDGGAACAPELLRCRYSANARNPADLSCTSSAVCLDGGWQVAVTTACPVNPAECPPSAEDAGGAACSGTGLNCAYPAGETCACLACASRIGVPCTQPYSWSCLLLDTVAGCPPTLPPDGMACCPLGARCGYAGRYCGGRLGSTAECTDGGWINHPPQACPN